MMMVGSLFTSLFGGGAAAAGAGAAAAGAATATASGMGLTILQGVGSVFTALATIGQGKAKADELKAAAKEEEFKATDEKIKGEQQSAQLEKHLALTLQRQKVAFAAGGVDLSSQAVEAAQTQAQNEAERQLGYVFTDSYQAMLARRRQAQNYKIAADAAISQSYMSALTGVLETGLDVANRYG